jgi:hypothetical protein
VSAATSWSQSDLPGELANSVPPVKSSKAQLRVTATPSWRFPPGTLTATNVAKLTSPRPSQFLAATGWADPTLRPNSQNLVLQQSITSPPQRARPWLSARTPLIAAMINRKQP